MDTLHSVSLRCKSKILALPIALAKPHSDSALIVKYCLFELIHIVVVKRQEMVSRVDTNNWKHFPDNTLGTSGAQEIVISTQVG